MKENSEPLIRAYGAIEETLNEVSHYVKVYKHPYVCVHCMVWMCVCTCVCTNFFVSHLGMVTVPESLGHGNGEHYKSSRRGSFQMGEATNGHKVCALHYYLQHDLNPAIK